MSGIYCRWGRYEAAKVTAHRGGLYSVVFLDGSTAWCAASELTTNEQPPADQLSRLEAGAVVLLPVADAYMHASLVRHVRPNHLEVQAYDLREPGTVVVPCHEVRLPLAFGVRLGEGLRLSAGTSVFALLGEWAAATVDKSAPSLGWHVTVQLRRPMRTVSAWCPGAQLIGPPRGVGGPLAMTGAAAR